MIVPRFHDKMITYFWLDKDHVLETKLGLTQTQNCKNQPIESREKDQGPSDSSAKDELSREPSNPHSFSKIAKDPREEEGVESETNV
jgi:hypothetical protein